MGFLSRIDRYLLRQLTIACLFICAVVILVVLFTQSFRLLALVVDNAASVMVFLRLAALTIPTFAALILPLGLAIAVTFIYYKSTADSELVAMRAAGTSTWRLAMPSFLMGIVMTLFCLVLTLWVSPWANRELVKLQYQVRNDYSVLLVRPGVFNDITKGLTFYARSRNKDNSLEGILIHDTRNPDTPTTIMAERGMTISQEGEPRIVVFQGRRQEYDRVNKRLTQLDFERYTFDLALLDSSGYSRTPDPRELTTQQIIAPDKSLLEQGITRERLTAELHQRLAMPLFAIGLPLMCAAILLAGEFNRRGMSKRLLVATSLVIILQACLLWIMNIATKQPAFAPVFYLTSIFPFLIGLWRLSGVPSFRMPRPAVVSEAA